MEINKKKLFEIIDSNGELIGQDSIPKNGSDLESQAHGTTDQNAKIGPQPYRYDMLGRFGFSMLPFYEGKEIQEQPEIFQELVGLMHERYAEFLEYYFKHPNKLKPDYRKSTEEGHGHDEECEKSDIKWAESILDIFEKYSNKPKSIDESKVSEDTVLDKKSEDEMTKKSADKDVQEKKLEKIAGLINKLDKKDINKLKNLLEIENE